MRASALSFLALLAVSVPATVTAWTSGQGAEIHWYSDATCGAYAGHRDAFYTKAPFVGTAGNGGATCISLTPPSNAKSINTAAIWPKTTTTAQPRLISGYCVLYDGTNCSGNTKTSTYVPRSGTCIAARSSAGFLWKSALCNKFVEASTTSKRAPRGARATDI